MIMGDNEKLPIQVVASGSTGNDTTIRMPTIQQNPSILKVNDVLLLITYISTSSSHGATYLGTNVYIGASMTFVGSISSIKNVRVYYKRITQADINHYTTNGLTFIQAYFTQSLTADSNEQFILLRNCSTESAPVLAPVRSTTPVTVNSEYFYSNVYKQVATFNGVSTPTVDYMAIVSISNFMMTTAAGKSETKDYVLRIADGGAGDNDGGILFSANFKGGESAGANFSIANTSATDLYLYYASLYAALILVK